MKKLKYAFDIFRKFLKRNSARKIDERKNISKMKKQKIVFLYEGPHPVHAAWARTVGAKFIPDLGLCLTS